MKVGSVALSFTSNLSFLIGSWSSWSRPLAVPAFPLHVMGTAVKENLFRDLLPCFPFCTLKVSWPLFTKPLYVLMFAASASEANASAPNYGCEQTLKRPP